MGNFDHCYQILGLKPGASMEEVNKAYKSLVVIWHPDRIPKENTDLLARAEHKLKEINQARDVLRERSRAASHTTTTTQQKHKDKAQRYHPYAAYRAHYEARQSHSHSRSTGARENQTSTAGTYQGASADSSAYRPGSVYTAKSHNSYSQSAKTQSPSDQASRSGHHSAHPHSGHTDEKRKTTRNTASYYWGSSNTSAQGRAANAEKSQSGHHSKSQNYQDYYAQSRYNPAYEPSKQTPPKPHAAKTASPQPPISYANGDHSAHGTTANSTPAQKTSQTAYRPPQPMGYSPPKNYTPPGVPRKPDLSGADFAGHNLREKDLSDHNLSKANLSKADLSDSFLHRIDLSYANLEGANLFRANLLEANLKGANMKNVNLIGADLSGCDLSGADLTGAQVGFNDRVMVKMTGARLNGAIMPNGKVYQA